MQAALQGIFASHGLDRDAEQDAVGRAKLSLTLLDLVTYRDSANVVLTFDSYPGEERADIGEDDLSCLGVGPAARA